MAATDDEEDDYLSMSFGEPVGATKETSLQRAARLKREAAERGRIKSKKEIAEEQRLAREQALATQLDASNKGAKMMAKMGFKGGALGRSEDARTQPIELLMKDDRGGIGMDSEKRKRVREAAEEAAGKEKRQKVDEGEYVQRTREERDERRCEGMWWSAIRVLEGFEEEDGETEGGKANLKPLRSVNLLLRPLVKQRLEKERERRMKYDLEQSLSSRQDCDDPDAEGEAKVANNTAIEDLDEEDPELEGFEALSSAERLGSVVAALREKYNYCFWCKYRYPDDTFDGCPGLTEDEHG